MLKVNQQRRKNQNHEIAGVVIKFNKVCDPDLIGLKMHNEIQMLNEQLLIEQKQKLLKAKSNIQGLILRLMIRKSSTYWQQTNIHELRSRIYQQIFRQELLIQFIIIHHLLNHLLLNHQKHLQIQLIHIKDNNFKMNSTKRAVIPKLDLKRAKQIQEINAKRQMQSLITQNIFYLASFLDFLNLPTMTLNRLLANFH
ncbi:unnamed protein product [Paramecium sonneborni]|uniref:Uncharacterized protein n=1 Tax=Paramecium sonneborni TaxID=65129 RepID=A0A8S1RMU6_9CILI|nr:unnamed protein product [Paramecium sonneborni]